MLDPVTRLPDYDDGSVTENSRVAYPLEYIPNTFPVPNAFPADIAKHPSNIVFLTADAFGVLPPIAQLTPEQAIYYFLRRMRGFTASDQREWVYWNDNKKFMFKPVSAAKYANNFLFSRADVVLVMSGTILDFDVFCRSVGLARTDCECLALPSDFLVKNRPIFYRPIGSMNWHNKEATLPKIAEELSRLLNVYPRQKGLIHTNSYAMNERNTPGVRSKISGD